MRIHEAAKKTGLSRKAIHFYVNEGLVHPKKLDNNYYEFSDDDLEVLNQILILRKAGISIQTIKEIYDYPAATNFFLHRAFNQMKIEIAEKMTQLENLETLLETIPPNGTPKEVGSISLDMLRNETDTYWIDTRHPSFDERIIAILILAPFMDIQVDEYKQYLWDKIFNDLKAQFKEDLPILKQLIYSLSGTQVREASTYQFNLMKKMAEDNEIQPYADHLIECIELLIQDEVLQKKWMLLYEKVLIPVEHFFRRTSEKKRISQYNPMFDAVSEKLVQVVDQVACQISGSELEDQLKKAVQGKIVIDNILYSDLFILFTFHKSIYSQCSLELIQKAVTENSSR